MIDKPQKFQIKLRLKMHYVRVYYVCKSGEKSID